MIRTPILAGAMILALAVPSLADGVKLIKNPNATRTVGGPWVHGEFDLTTGDFRRAPSGSTVDPRLVVNRNGRVTVNINIVVRTPGLNLKTVSCSARIDPYPSDRDEGDERDTTAPVSGGTAHCTLVINYQWHVDPATAKLEGSINVGGTNASGDGVRFYGRDITAENGDPIPPNFGSVTYSEDVIL